MCVTHLCYEISVPTWWLQSVKLLCTWQATYKSILGGVHIKAFHYILAKHATLETSL
jgi:hypothetical protein